MPEVFQTTTVVIFLVNFLFGVYLHDYLQGLGIFALIYFSTFFASDFSFIPSDVGIYYHVWSVLLALLSNLAGFYFAIAYRLDPLITTQAWDEKNRNRPVSGTVGIQFHVLFVALTTFGINAWIGRTIIPSGGVSPIGVDLTGPGIGSTVAGVIGLVLTTIMLAVSKYDEFKLTAKYVWILPLVPVTIVINDIGQYAWPYQLGMFIAFVGMWFIVYALMVYVPSKKTVDPFYRRKTYALYITISMALITLIELLLMFIVTVWIDPTLSLETGMIITVVWAGVVMLGSIIASFAVSDEKIAKIKPNLAEYETMPTETVEGRVLVTIGDHRTVSLNNFIQQKR
jgi:hypothetical protein